MIRLKQISLLILVFILTLTVVGCSKNTRTVPNAMNTNDTDFNLTLASSTIDYENAFTSRDLSADYDENIYNIKLADNHSTCDNSKVEISENVITIANTGTYILEGKLSDGTVVVNADNTDKIQLVLNGVEINNNSTSAIKILQAKKVFVTLAENTKNVLSSPKEFVKTDEDKADGVIYAKDNLTLNGSGQLTLTSAYGHGIVCNDDLIIADGVYSIGSKKHAIKAEDNIYLAGGDLRITCGKDALHCEHDTDSSKGNIYIKDTTMQIAADDEGIQVSGFFIIDGGTIRISQSDEGIEAQKIEINGGSIQIKSSDDGLNASSGNSTGSSTESEATTSEKTFDKTNPSNPFDSDENCYISIADGDLIIDADGDGIDSNGYLQQCGGNVTVYGPENDGNAAIDYGISAKISGGTIAAFGCSGMAQGFSSYSTQASMLINFDNTTNEKFVLTDSKSNELISGETEKKYNSVLVSTSLITVGNTYIAAAGNQSKEIELETISYLDSAGQQNKRGFKGGRGENSDEMPSENAPSDMPALSDDGEMGDRPEMPDDDKKAICRKCLMAVKEREWQSHRMMAEILSNRYF
ncbi:MAG: carbohydrate-binding domain-containing protein [Clostridium sp.]|nr:carbohydrate-binding domain-containing protein [Clostridium sp.]